MGEGDRPIVILAEKAKPQMDAMVAEGLGGLQLEVHTRSGRPHSLADLQHVAAGLAKNLLLLNPDTAEVCPLPRLLCSLPDELPGARAARCTAWRTCCLMRSPAHVLHDALPGTYTA